MKDKTKENKLDPKTEEIAEDALEEALEEISDSEKARFHLDDKIEALLKKMRLTLPRIFILIALFEGLIYAFLFPCAQIPDEYNHYMAIENSFGTTGYAKEMKKILYKKAGYGSLIGNLEKRVDREKSEKYSSRKFSQPFKLSNFHPNIGVLKYLPAGLGFYLGIMLGLPILTCTHLAEIFATLFFVFIGALTIKLTPVKKDMFMFCMLIPMTLQQCSSVNYDSVLIPLCFLLFAFILNLRFREKKIGWKDIIICLVLTGIIAVIKVPYIFILGALLIIPHDRFDLKIGGKFEVAGFIRRFWYIFIILACIMVVLVGFVGRNNENVKTIIANVLEFSRFKTVMTNTYKAMGPHHITGIVGLFSWHEISVSMGFVLLFFIVMTYMNTDLRENVIKYISGLGRAWLLILSIIMILLVYIAMQTWTYKTMGLDLAGDVTAFRSYLSNIETIQGVQGRYFIPVLPMILAALSGTRKAKNRIVYYTVQYGFYAFSFLNVVYHIYVRFWV